MKLIFATNNPHKLSELKAIAGDSFDIVSLAEIGCRDDIPETADTLEGNALQKARYVYERYGLACFADDTGLEVDALGGEPGVRSARYASDHSLGTTPDDNMRLLLQKLGDTDNRHARFRTVIALIDADGTEHLVDGKVEGEILRSHSGHGGFGYDPIFAPEGFGGQSFAEMSPEQKNSISHRGRASQALMQLLKTN